MVAASKHRVDGSYIVKSCIGIAIMLCFRFLPPIDPITPAGVAVIGEFIGLIYLWTAVDMLWPTFVGMVLFGVDALVIYPNSWQNAGVYEAGMESWGNWVTVFVIACLLICWALEKAGVIKRIVVWFITRKFARKSGWTFTFMFLLGVLLISLFLDVTPAQFFALGLAHELFQIMGFKKGDRWPKFIIIGLTYTAILGFAMTPICHTLPILWMSIYSAMTGEPSNMLAYMAIGLPVGLIIWLLMFVWFRFGAKLDCSVVEKNVDWEKIDAMKPGPMDLREKIVVACALGLLACWLIPGFLALFAPESAVYAFFAKLTDSSFLFLAVVALAVVALAVVKVDGVPCLDLKRAFQEINWLPVVLLAGIMMIAGCMGEETTGIPQFIVQYVVPLVSGMAPYAMIATICVICIIFTNIANNVPVGIILISAGVPMCMEMGINPFIIAVAVSVAANLAYTIPPVYVPVGVAYADEYCEGKSVLLNGIAMAVISMIVCAVLIYPLGLLVAP